MPLQSISIACRGGLNLSATFEELLDKPGEAIQLINMEASRGGGYRRVDGYAEYGITSIPGSGTIKGIIVYRGGVLAARGVALYHSFTGTTWTKVNKLVSGVNHTTLEAHGDDAELSTSGELNLQMEVYTEGTIDHMYIATGNSDPLYLKIDGSTEGSSTYTFREVAEGAALTGARYLTIFEDQTILANTTADPTSFIWSSRATTDLTSAEVSAGKTVRENYDGSTSGSISVKRPITGIHAHRNNLYIFTERTISRVEGLKDGNPLVVPITTNIGCISGDTIQEVGGDIIFLAADGLRTVSQTQKIQDVDLGVISGKVSPITDTILENLANYTFTSTVIRKKSQYRLWYKDSTLDPDEQRALVAVLNNNSGGGLSWDYSELVGWTALVADSGEATDATEFNVFADASKVYVFEKKEATYDGTQVVWVYQSPYTHLGIDIGIRKCPQKVYVNMKPTGTVSAELELRFDYGDNLDTPQPLPYPLELEAQPALFGDPSTIFGDPATLFGATGFSNQDVNTEGSGFTVSFKIRDVNEEDDPFELQSYQANFLAQGRT